jgi:hypothetical protein
MSDEQAERCGGCEHFRAEEADPSSGACWWRPPPSPPVDADDHCGEFAPLVDPDPFEELDALAEEWLSAVANDEGEPWEGGHPPTVADWHRVATYRPVPGQPAMEFYRRAEELWGVRPVDATHLAVRLA